MLILNWFSPPLLPNTKPASRSRKPNSAICAMSSDRLYWLKTNCVKAYKFCISNMPWLELYCLMDGFVMNVILIRLKWKMAQWMLIARENETETKSQRLPPMTSVLGRPRGRTKRPATAAPGFAWLATGPVTVGRVLYATLVVVGLMENAFHHPSVSTFVSYRPSGGRVGWGGHGLIKTVPSAFNLIQLNLMKFRYLNSAILLAW